MTNKFEFHSVGYDSPGKIGPSGKATKSDTVDLPDGVPRAFLVGTAGTANLIDEDDVTHANVPMQQGFNPLRGIKRIKTSGTADDIWPLY